MSVEFTPEPTCHNSNPISVAPAGPLSNYSVVPEWSQDGKPGPINGRSETVAPQHPFAESFTSRRCLIPTTGFYEWVKEGQQKIPSFFRHKGGGLMAFAGLWAVWVNPETDKLHFSCCLLTTESNELIKGVHDRMPVILRIDDYAAWLDKDTEERVLKALLKPYPAERMESWPVATLVNKATVEGPELINPVEAA